MVVLRRCYESSTQDTLKKIVNLLKAKAKDVQVKNKEGKKIYLVVDKPELKSLTIRDRKNPDNAVTLILDLMSSNSGEVIIKLDNRIWKMGDTFIKDRKGGAGSEKRPDMEKQVENILDMVASKISKM